MAGARGKRFSDEQIAAIGARRHGATAGAKYGHTSFADQGYRMQKEYGMAGLNRWSRMAQHGAFAPVSWDYVVRDGKFFIRPMGNQTERIAEFKRMGLDPTQYTEASRAGFDPKRVAAMERSLNNPERQKFLAENPQLASVPGGGWDAWLHQKYLNSLATDPETGWAVNQAGELYDPSNRILQAYLGGGGGRTGPGSSPGGAGGRFPGGAGGGGYQIPGAPPGTPPIIPTMPMPWDIPTHQMGGPGGMGGLTAPTAVPRGATPSSFFPTPFLPMGTNPPQGQVQGGPRGVTPGFPIGLPSPTGNTGVAGPGGGAGVPHMLPGGGWGIPRSPSSGFLPGPPLPSQPSFPAPTGGPFLHPGPSGGTGGFGIPGIGGGGVGGMAGGGMADLLGRVQRRRQSRDLMTGGYGGGMPRVSAATGYYSPFLPQTTNFTAHPGEQVSVTPAWANPFAFGGPAPLPNLPSYTMPQQESGGRDRLGGAASGAATGAAVGSMIPGVGTAIGGIIGGLGGLLFGGKPKKPQTQSNVFDQSSASSAASQNMGLNLSNMMSQSRFGQNTNSLSRTNTSNRFSNQFESAPFVTAQFSPMVNMIRSALENRIGRRPEFMQNLRTQGIIDANRSFAGAGKALANRLAATGGTGGLAAGTTALESARASNISDFLRTLPLTARQIENEDLSMAQTLADMFGKGTRGTQAGTSTGVSTTRGTSSTTGWQDALQQAMEQMYGMSSTQGLNRSTGMSQGQASPPPGGGFMDSLMGLAGILAANGGLGRRGTTPPIYQGSRSYGG